MCVYCSWIYTYTAPQAGSTSNRSTAAQQPNTKCTTATSQHPAQPMHTALCTADTLPHTPSHLLIPAVQHYTALQSTTGHISLHSTAFTPQRRACSNPTCSPVCSAPAIPCCTAVQCLSHSTALAARPSVPTSRSTAPICCASAELCCTAVHSTTQHSTAQSHHSAGLAPIQPIAQ